MSATDQAAMAQRNLERYGEAMVLRKRTAGTYSPATGGFTGETSTDIAITAFPRPYTQRETFGSSIEVGDIELRIAPGELEDAGVVPRQGDFVVWNSEDYRVLAVEPKRASGIPLFWVAQVRGVE